MDFSISPFIIQFTDTIGIRWYSLMYVLGIAITYFWLTRKAGYPNKPIEDFVLGGILSAVVGARLLYITYYNPFLLSSVLESLAIWKGGLSFHGGLIGLLLFTVFFAKRKRWKLMEFLDNLVIPAALFLTFGRIGNFLNNELWGTITNLPWCLVTEKLEGCRHPSQLYEALYNLLLFIMLMAFRKSSFLRTTGVKSGVFLVWYGSMRSLVETWWRVPDFTWNGMTSGQILSIPMIIAGILLLAWSLKTSQKRLPHATINR